MADASGWRNQSPIHLQPVRSVQQTQRIEATGIPRSADSHGGRETLAVALRAVGAAGSVVGGAITSVALRHWLIEALATICVMGGILAAPVLAIIAWVGLLLPTQTLLHLVAPTLMITALVWLVAAILGAHVSHLLKSRQLAE
ncbi:MAG: hypothetical protein ABI068_08285 [Ktedonobacterales bacterium]